jgi:hypothetical protein
VVVTADEGIRYVDGYSKDGGVTISPTPSQTSEELPTFTYPSADADCALLPDRGSVNKNGNDSVTLEPGRYSKITINKGTVTMNPGLYCVSGDFKITGGNTTGMDVMIYMQKDGNKNTDFVTNGSATINISAPRTGNWFGMLLYMAHGNEGELTIAGNSDSSYTGTVYAPNAHVNVGGNNSTLGNYSTQIIAYTVEIFGTTEMEINFDDTIHYSNPSFIDMYE